MNYIIFDLEWNQPACMPDDMPVDGLPFEIIEIGAVKLDETFQYSGEFHRIIAPVVYPHIHSYTESLTHITVDELRSGDGFVRAMESFNDWCGDGYIFCTWGMTDVTELQRNMNYYHMPLFDFPVCYYDLQKIFSIQFEDGKLRRSLDYAVDFLNIPVNNEYHRALFDARYTAEIFRRLDINIVKTFYSIDTYQLPTDKKNEIYAVFEYENINSYSKYISKGYESKTDLMSDKTVLTTACYKCGRKLRKKIRWFSCSSKTYYCLAHCPVHGLMKGKIRIKRHDSGLFYAVRTLKYTDDNGAAAIYSRQADIRKKRREKRHASKL